MVILNTLVLTPFVLYALGFSSKGMDWVHGALFASMLAPTDAVSVTALLKAGTILLYCKKRVQNKELQSTRQAWCLLRFVAV